MSKTPDKIYIPDEWLHIPSNHFETEDSPGATEYIRKDALLEWAKAKHMELDPPQNERDFGRIEAVEELISKLQSL